METRQEKVRRILMELEKYEATPEGRLAKEAFMKKCREAVAPLLEAMRMSEEISWRDLHRRVRAV